jgi:hypothetical protein
LAVFFKHNAERLFPLVISALNREELPKRGHYTAYDEPVRAGINWNDIESLLVSLGVTVRERAGSRVCVMLGNESAVFHRPHPRKETDKGVVKSVRRFLENAGVKP